MRYILC